MAYRIAHQPFWVALDDNGKPISGAQLIFYASGTTTPLTTWSDSALSVPNASPVLSNAAGRFPTIYLDDSVAYRVKMFDASGTLIPGRDVDPLFVPVTVSYPDLGFDFHGAGILTNERMWLWQFRSSATYPANFTGSGGTCLINPTAAFTISVRKNATAYNTGTQIGTIAVSTGGGFTFATTGSAAQSFVAGDTISCWAPTAIDATAGDIAVTFKRSA